MYFCAGACEISIALANAQVISFNSLIDCCVFMVRLWLPSPGCHCACVALCRALTSFHSQNPPRGRPGLTTGRGWLLLHGTVSFTGTCHQQPLAGWMDGWLLPLWVFNLGGGADEAGGEEVLCSPLLHLLTGVNLPVSKQISEKPHQIGCASLTLHL